MFAKLKLLAALARAKLLLWWRRQTVTTKTVISVASVALTGAVTAAVWSTPVAVAVVGIVAGHELGHWVAARVAGGQADLPVLVPLGVAVIGLTRIWGLARPARRWVYMAGPVLGAVIAVGVALVGYLSLNAMIFAVGVGALGYEILAGTYGSDGRRFRAAC